jgi:hypothetical protein
VAADGNVLVYTRSYGDSRVLVALNLGATAHELPLVKPQRALLSTYLDRAHDVGSEHLELRGDEGIILG